MKTTSQTTSHLARLSTSSVLGNINEADLHLGYIRAIADLVAHSNHEELHDNTIGEAMYAIGRHVHCVHELMWAPPVEGAMS